MKVLVAVASKHGSTEELGHAIAERLRAHGLEVEEGAPNGLDLDSADAVVVGSAVYAGRWLSQARSFVRAHLAELRRLPVWAFSSGPVGDPPRPAEEAAEGRELAELMHARGHRTLVGRLDPAGLSLGERAIARLIGASTADRRDWQAVDRFADEIAEELGTPDPAE
jgi:menaquinone-dependent protoporphyrinogen oxidase